MSRSKIKFINEFDGVMSDHVFMAGVYQTVITPPVGFKIFSPEFPEIISTSVNDDLLAKVITMSTLKSELVLIGLDHLSPFGRLPKIGLRPARTPFVLRFSFISVYLRFHSLIFVYFSFFAFRIFEKLIH